MKLNPAVFEQADIYAIINAIAEEVFAQCEEMPFDELDTVAQNSVVLIGLDEEIDQGGFLQFIENSSGDFYAETLAAAKAINNKGLIEALQKVASQFPEGKVPTEILERQEILDAIKENGVSMIPFDQLDADIKADLIASHDGSFPLESSSFALEDTIWDELDQWYYENHQEVYTDFIQYLKAQA